MVKNNKSFRVLPFFKKAAFSKTFRQMPYQKPFYDLQPFPGPGVRYSL
ncbi:hypothetical protein SXCC_01604 [Gluconacetobacter sp. SXCC-1]|nr:hypothetical protein SXCC_01604 [Gluconacetobacter sp. SXCC-1]